MVKSGGIARPVAGGRGIVYAGRDCGGDAMTAKNAGGHNGLTYADAGVDIAAGNLLVERIKPAAKATGRAGVMGGLGGFGALFDLKAAGYVDPVLVAATLRSNSAPKPPRPPITPARPVALAAGLIRSTSRLPAAISTPASA